MHRTRIRIAAVLAASAAATGIARAGAPFSCAGVAQLGGAILECSHTDAKAPPQICTYSWSLVGDGGPTVVQGSFMLVPGTQNAMVYQGAGFSYALANPIVLCQGRKMP